MYVIVPVYDALHGAEPDLAHALFSTSALMHRGPTVYEPILADCLTDGTVNTLLLFVFAIYFPNKILYMTIHYVVIMIYVHYLL